MLPGTPPADVQRLQGYLGDLAAVVALPALWSGTDDAHIAEGLANVLAKILPLDFVHVRLKGPANEGVIEVSRPEPAADAPEPVWAVSQLLAPRVNGQRTEPVVLTRPHPLTHDLVQVVVMPIGNDGEFGELAAASAEPDFPSEQDRLLIGVIVNQATVVLQRRQAEAALRRSERELADFFEHAPVGLHWVGPDGTILRANRAELDLLGYSRDEYVGRPIVSFHADREAGAAMLQRLRNGEELHGHEARLRCKDGSIKHVLIDSNVHWQDGQFVHSRCFTRNVTDERRADHMARFLARSGADYTCVGRFDGRELSLESASAGFTQVTGYTIEEFTLQVATLAIHPEDIFPVVQNFERLTRGETVSGEARIITKSGDQRWLRYLAEPSFEPGDAQVLRIRGTAQDITDHQRAGERLQEAERQFRQLAENINEVFWIADPLRTQIFYCSPAFAAIWGHPCESLRQQPWLWPGSVLPEDRERFAAALEAAGRGEPADVEYRITRPDGAVRWVRERSFPVKDAEGQLFRVVGVADDFTDRQRMEAALHEANRRKDEFLAMLAHELRNPLAPIRNAVQILRAKGSPIPEVQWARDVIDRQAQQLTRLVDDLLDVSRITRGKIQLRKERIELAGVVSGVLEAVSPLIEKWSHELTVSLPPEPIVLDADPTRLAQILQNLLNNAAKYTNRGGHIALSAERAADHVQIRVKDTGIGIPQEMLSQIFDMFTQVDHAVERSQGGLGIGLTLVQRLVEMHGGSIRAHSDGPGTGSEFIVDLPVAAEVEVRPPPEEAKRAAAAPDRCRILVVDDNRDAADSLGMLLRLGENEVEVCYDGLEAVAAAAVFRPDVILMDIGLPKLNGYEAARQIRSQPGGDAIMLFALTGWGQEDDRRRSSEAGFNGHFTKPVEFTELQALLASLNGGKAKEPAAQAEGSRR